MSYLWVGCGCLLPGLHMFDPFFRTSVYSEDTIATTSVMSGTSEAISNEEERVFRFKAKKRQLEDSQEHCEPGMY